MERAILHCDCDAFYCSVEMLRRPHLRNVPMVVGGSEESRHGIVLSKNIPAKKYGIKTGESLVAARQKCRELVTIPADYTEYLRFSKFTKEIFSSYTPLKQDFGLDESWLDVTGCRHAFGTGVEIAHKIRQQIFLELGITVSIGVSYNKIFSKLGSDLAKNTGGVSVITRENYMDTVWKLPANELMYVGPATFLKLAKYNIMTIGDLAKCNTTYLRSWLGKWGLVLHRFANGDDLSPVDPSDSVIETIKSVGNSTTLPRDVKTADEAKSVMWMLAESVAERLRGHFLKCTGVQISLRDKNLATCERQGKLEFATFVSNHIAEKALDIFEQKHEFRTPLRSIGVRAINLVPADKAQQLSLFIDHEQIERLEKAEHAVDNIRRRFGYHVIQKGLIFVDKGLTGLHPQNDQHLIHPVNYFEDRIM